VRYDDIEAHKSLVEDNVKLVNLVKETQNQNIKILKRLEKISNNANIKYLNFKVIGGSLLIGIIIGIAIGMGMTIAYVHPLQQNNSVVVKKEVAPSYDFNKPISIAELKKQKFELLGVHQIKMNGKLFKSNDFINGYKFIKATSTGRILFLPFADKKPFWVITKYTF